MFSLLLLLAAFAVCDGTSINGWQRTSAQVDKSQPMVVTFFLQQNNLEKLDKMFWDVSDPDSDNYGKYLSDTEITSLVGNPTAEKIVTQWLSEQDVSLNTIHRYRTRDALKVHLSVETVERLFSVKVHQFKHLFATNRTILRTATPFSLHPHIRSHVSLVTGLHDFPPLPKTRAITRESLLNKALDRHIMADSMSGMAPGSVQLVIQFPDNHEVKISFMVTCPNGKEPTDANAVCANEGGILQALTVYGRNMIRPHDTFQTEAQPDCAMQKGKIVCNVVATGLKSYEPYVMELSAAFMPSGGPPINGPWFVTPPTVATPWQTADSVKALYNIPEDETVATTDSTSSVGEFEQQYYSQADLETWFQLMGVRNTQLKNVTVVGPNHKPYGDEASLDIQWLMGLAPGSPMTYWSVKATSTAEIDNILEWGYQVMNATKNKRPLINSLSYGMTEVNVDKYLGKGYMARSEVQFKIMALSGLTILIADGDEGAYDLGGPPMSASTCDRPHADWPSNSQHVTSVGATFATPFAEPICYNDKIGIDCSGQPIREAAVGVDYGMIWTTGGGFSNFTKRAPYQQKQVEHYMEKQGNFSIFYNKMGRAYPDVSAVGHALTIVQNGKTMQVDGTSASCPIFAAVMTLINGQRLIRKLPPLGFANPLLYKIAEMHPEAFNDVTVGNNRCGAFGPPPLCCPTGYDAEPGWDPLTGLGTPNYPELKAAANKVVKRFN